VAIQTFEVILAGMSEPNPATARATAEQLMRSPELRSRTDDLVRIAAHNDVLLRTLTELDLVGADLESLAISTSTYKSQYAAKAFPSRDDRSAVTLRDLFTIVQTHDQLLQEARMRLARAAPFGFVLAYGTGIVLAHPQYRLRSHHDTDLFAESMEHAAPLLTNLGDQGYSVTNSFTRQVGDKAVTKFKLKKLHESGHWLLVDFFVGGRPGRYKVPYVVLPRLFDAAQAVTFTDGSGVLVPAPEEMLILLAEKVQRKATYTRRSVNDARILLTSGSRVQWDIVRQSAQQIAIEPALDWLLAHVDSPTHTDEIARMRSTLELTSLDRRLTTVVSSDSAIAPRRFRRARKIQRYLWLTRFARRQGLSLRQAWPHFVGRA
jgi:hypothetical protein